MEWWYGFVLVGVPIVTLAIGRVLRSSHFKWPWQREREWYE